MVPAVLRQISADQLVVDVVIEDGPLSGTGAFDIFEEINGGVAGAADGAIANSPDDFFELLFLPGSIASVGYRQDRAETDWLKLTDGVHAELQKVLAQGQKLAAARGAQAVEEAKQYDALVQQFQNAQLAAIDEFKGRAGTRVAGKLDEYKTQLKAALLDIRGRDYAAVKFTMNDLLLQFRIAPLEQEIREMLMANRGMGV